jgi:hypothetical protein
MNYDITTILAIIAIVFVLISYIATAPLLPIAVILLGWRSYSEDVDAICVLKVLINSTGVE